MNIKKIKEKIAKFIEYLRGLDDKNKKTILWVIVVILGIIMAFFWIKSVMYKLEHLEPINLDFSQVEVSTGLENTQNLINNSLNNTEINSVK